MRLVVDTSDLVGELLRARGRRWLGDDRLELFIPEQMWAEMTVELPRRIAAFARARGLGADVEAALLNQCLESAAANMLVIEAAVYGALEDDARARSLRDPTDWPVVACALALGAAVWTNDNDFLGTGVATWTTQTLQLQLDRMPNV